MTQAIFLNGVFEDVLTEDLEAQKSDPDWISFLQPYSSSRIVLLDREKPSIDRPIPLYLSTTTNLNNVSYTAMIVGWENKTEMSEDRVAFVNKMIQKFQPGEESVYMHVSDGKKCVNLISVKHLVLLPNPVSVSNLRKRDGSAVKPRSRAGNWDYVSPLPDWLNTSTTILEEQLDRELEAAINRSMKDDGDKRKQRLAVASAFPERVQVVSYVFRRNPDVVAEVLKRAGGTCESCGREAPFLRASDKRPFLEIHHRATLAAGGEDTVANSIALCPNCHRKMQFGIKTDDH